LQFKNIFIVSFIIIFGTLSFPIVVDNRLSFHRDNYRFEHTELNGKAYARPVTTLADTLAADAYDQHLQQQQQQYCSPALS